MNRKKQDVDNAGFWQATIQEAAPSVGSISEFCRRRRLFAAWALLLPQDIEDLIDSESADRMRLGDGADCSIRAVLPDQIELFGNLACQRAVGLGQTAELRFD